MYYIHLYYKLFLILFQISLAFNMCSTLVLVRRSQIEWKLKVKTQISVFPWAKIGQNDHSNPYIESTTVLSDTCTCLPSPPHRWVKVEVDFGHQFLTIHVLVVDLNRLRTETAVLDGSFLIGFALIGECYE